MEDVNIDLLNKKWKVFRVSPMYNFASNKLKFLEKTFTREINSKKKQANFHYKSIFKFNKNLTLNDCRYETLKVTAIKSLRIPKIGRNIEVLKDESKPVYLGHFISVEHFYSGGENSVTPILLVEAKEYEIFTIHSLLCKIFDCDLQPVTFSLYAMITFFVKFLETPRNDIDVSHEEISLEFRMPEGDAKDKIKVSLFLEATTIVYAVIMDNLKEKYQQIETKEILWEFYNKILNHIHHIFEMDLILAELYKVTFPDAFCTMDGQIKMTTYEAAVSALHVLQCFTPIDAIIESSDSPNIYKMGHNLLTWITFLSLKLEFYNIK